MTDQEGLRLVWAGEDVAREVERSVEKFGWQYDRPMGDWLAILVEEVGEVARAINEANLGGVPSENKALEGELIQVAAMAVKMLLAARQRGAERR
jgi:NTP pyrophosphatase (non-canonical NTP hydrolase)